MHFFLWHAIRNNICKKLVLFINRKLLAKTREKNENEFTKKSERTKQRHYNTII